MSFDAYKQLGVDFTDVGTTVLHTLGTEVMGPDGRVFRYIQAAGTIAAGDLLTYATSGTNRPYTMLGTSALNQPVSGVGFNAIPSGSYGWVVVKGPVANLKVAASTAAGSQIGSSATAATGTAITVSASPTQAEVQRALAAASGLGVTTTTAEASGIAPAVLA